MNCGLGNLIDLKRALLMENERSATTYDAAVTAIGLGVASLFDSVTGRRLAWMENDTFEFDPERMAFVVPRYPIASVASIELRSTLTEGFIVQDGQPVNFRRESGMLLFGGVTLGLREDTARVTWTGGYWFDTSENGSGTMPEGATALPGDLKLAWLQQAKFFWDRASIIERAKAGFDKGDGFLTDASELIATVKQTLDQYRRFGA